MANEYVARNGLKVLSNGAVITGSSQVQGDITASGDVVGTNFRGSGQFLTDIAADSVQFDNVLNKPTLISSSAQFTSLSAPFTGSFTGSFTGDGSGLTGIAATLAISGSTGNDTVDLKNDALTFSGSNGVTTAVTDNTVTIAIPAGTVSASSQVDHDATTNFVANEHIDHSTVEISAGNGLSGGGNITATRTLTLDTGSAHFTGGVKTKLNTDGVVSSSAQIVSALPVGTVSASSQVDHDATTNFVANEHVDHSTVEITAGAGLNGGGNITATRTLSVDSGSMLPFYSSSIFSTVSGDITITAGGVASIAANSVELGTDTTGNYASEVTAGSGITVTGTAGEGTSFGVSLDTGSTHFTGGVVKALPTGTVSSSTQVVEALPAGTVSSSTQVVAALPVGTVSGSSQIIASDVTGIGNYAQLTGSNTFTAINTFSNTTNSTSWNNGAVVIDGGLGVGKDVWISGSVNILGLLTAVSTSIQYITSSQLDIGTNIINLNTDAPALRYAGLSVVDSGSIGVSASFLYDSLTNNWVFKHKDGEESTEDFSYALFGPLGTGPDDIPVLTGNYITKVEDDGHGHHLVTSSIFDNGAYVSVDSPLQVTGSISSSVGFSGNGAGLTNVAASSVDYANITNKPTLVSASSQIDHDATTNFVANEHIDHSTVDITAGNGLSGGGNITATRTLTLDTGSVHFTGGVKTKLNADSVVSSSAQIVAALPAGTVSASSQVDHDATTNFVANEHIDHSTVSITAGSGLTGGGDITTTRTVTLDTGSAHFEAGARKTISASNTTGAAGINLTYNNTTGAISGSLVNSAITINGTSVDLGGTRNVTLAQITAQGATTTDAVTLGGGAVIHGILYTSGSATGVAGPVTNQVVATVPTGSTDAAHFDYIIKDGTNFRTGTVMSVWNGATVEYTDTSTADIGNTLGANFEVDTSGGNVRLKFTVATGTWTVKTAIRLI